MAKLHSSVDVTMMGWIDLHTFNHQATLSAYANLLERLCTKILEKEIELFADLQEKEVAAKIKSDYLH